MAAFRPHRFGKYTIVDPVAVGGMAEIYRARVSSGSKDGPDRVIVIKKVIANLAQNPEFLQMFEEEIKITVGLTHPNIIQIYDYGKLDDQYFMAMEYVEGKNLRQFVKRLADMKSMFSIDMSCHIISQVCHALGYAHAFKDRLSGKPLGIVHRDISPQNVMISYDGAVKLFDFGIAKAKSASEQTRAGVIKGKPSYLSPEQINGEELDGRSDIFALGIVLWELLTAKRLFVADTDMGVLRLIQNAKIEPPSTFNPAVPQALDAIVLKSLVHDKQKRYQNAEEFQRDLHKFLYSFNPSFNPADLSYYALELFKTEIKEDRERLKSALAIEPVGDASEPEQIGKKEKPKLSTALADGLVSSTDFSREMQDKVQEKTGVLDFSPAIDLQVKKTKNNLGVNRPAPKKPGESTVIPPWSKKSGSSSGTSTGVRSIGTTHTTFTRRVEAKPESSGSGGKFFVALVVLAVAGIFGARQMGLLKGTPLAFLDPNGGGRTVASESPPAPVDASAKQVPAKPVAGGGIATAVVQTVSHPTVPVTAQGTVVLTANVPLDDCTVFVNGTPARFYGGQFTVPLHTPLSVQVSKPGYDAASFQLTAPDAKAIAYTVTLKQSLMGVLNFTTTPDAKLTFYGEGQAPVFLQSPVRNQQIPAGRYRVVIENELMGYKSETEVTIEPNKMTRVEKSLK